MFDIEYELTVDETTAVSDPYPAYAEFRCNRDTDSTPVTDSDRGRDRFEERYGGGATEPDVPEALRPRELVRLLALMHLNHSPTMISQMNFAQQGQMRGGHAICVDRRF
jgi:hypothetical protein